MNFEVCRAITADHPSLPGHFPGSPIVPGVVILDEVLATLTERRTDVVVNSIPLVKFLAPLKPDQTFTITFSEPRADEINFHCRVENQVIAEGHLRIGLRKS